MKVFAIKDRLIDYFMTPFAAQDEKNVMAAIATVINTEPYKDAIAQAPHHFEIWRLGEIDEEGHLHTSKELIAGCDSLIRARDPNRLQDGHRSLESREIAGQLRSPPKEANGAPRASQRVIEDGASAEVAYGKETRGAAPGVPPGA